MINKVILVGNAGKDPEHKKVKDQDLTKLSLATSESYKNKNGEWVENTEWHNITCWGALALIVAKNVKKGNQLYIEGKIQTKEHESKYYTSVIADKIKVLTKSDKSKSVKGEKDDIPF